MQCYRAPVSSGTSSLEVQLSRAQELKCLTGFMLTHPSFGWLRLIDILKTPVLLV